MTLVDILDVFNYALVLLYGVFLTAAVSGGWQTRREKLLVWCLCPVFLLVQTVCVLAFGMDAARQLYPLIVHLPLALALIFGLKKPPGIALVSVCTAYLCCQLPRCCKLVVAALTRSPLAGEIVYTVVIVPIFLFLRRYFAPAAQSAMEESPRSLLLFGSFPAIYYVFDYATAIYSDVFYSGSVVVMELLPTVLGLFYMVFTTAYRHQLLLRTQAELQGSLMQSQLKQAEVEMASLRHAEAQSAAYQHDMRHHLTAIGGFLSSGKPRQAEEYIQQVRSDMETITPRRFCENELVNLLCSSFSAKAARMGVRLTVKAAVPGSLPISDTELCALLSNGLENALNAAAALEEDRRWVELYCGVRLDKLLIEIKNPYAGQVLFRDGLPAAAQPGHGHGCRSIQTIAQTRRGLCEFQAEGGVFTLRAVLPV